jgi:hypothetical protein
MTKTTTTTATEAPERDYIGSADYYDIAKGHFISVIQSKLNPTDISNLRAVRRGLDYESELIKYASEKLKLDFVEQYEAQGYHEFTKAHIDGWNADTKTQLEIKTTQTDDWRTSLLPKWLYQVSFAQWCSGAQTCYLLVAKFPAGDDTKIEKIELVDITKEQARIGVDTEALRKFWFNYQKAKNGVLVRDSISELIPPADQHSFIETLQMLTFYKEQELKFREALLEQLEKSGLLESGETQFLLEIPFKPKVQITYIQPTTRASIDTKELKAKEPEIAEKYTVISPVKSSLRITLKKGEE